MKADNHAVDTGVGRASSSASVQSEPSAIQGKAGGAGRAPDSLRIAAVEQKQQTDARRKAHIEKRAAAVFAYQELVDALAKEKERFQVVVRVALKEVKQCGIDDVLPIKKALEEDAH